MDKCILRLSCSAMPLKLSQEGLGSYSWAGWGWEKRGTWGFSGGLPGLHPYPR